MTYFLANPVGKGKERVKIKIIVPIISNLAPNRELKKKNSKKIQNTKKRHNRFFSSPNWLGKVEKE